MKILGGIRQGTAGTLLTLAFLLAFILWCGYAVTMMNWMGLFGAFIALIAAPGIVIFPMLYWIVEDRFPVWYALLWIAVAILYAASAQIADSTNKIT